MPGAERLGDGAGEEIALGVEGEEAHRGLEQRAVHALAEAGLLALDDGGDTPSAQSMPVERSRKDTPARTGWPPGSPVMDMMPEKACMSAS